MAHVQASQSTLATTSFRVLFHHVKVTSVSADDRLGTTAVAMHSMTYAGFNIRLIDTPGFDVTYRTESDVLKEIAFWLTKAYASNVPLSGIIYLHNISAPRWTGSTRRGLAFLKSLCGSENYESVVLSTTMWDTVPQQVGME